MLKEVRINIHDFSNYRSFLKAKLNERKLRNKSFSISAWAKRLGLNGNSSLVMILNGQRNPSAELIEKLTNDLRLHQKEASYFRDLVALEKCSPKNLRAKQIILTRLEKTNPLAQFRSVTREQFAAISEWHHYAIRELFDLPNVQQDPCWIQKRLRSPVSIKSIEQALATLERLGLLIRDEKSGRLKYADKVTSQVDVPDESLHQFHKSMLNQAIESLQNISVEDREISAMTFTVSSKNIRAAKDLIKNFYQEMTQLGPGIHDSVYHLQVALFPLTKKGNSK